MSVIQFLRAGGLVYTAGLAAKWVYRTIRRCFPEPRLIDVGKGEMTAFFREAGGERLPDSGGGARNRRRLSRAHFHRSRRPPRRKDFLVLR